MNKDNINIGIVSKGRLKNFTENLLRKRKLKIFSERGERDLFGKIKGKSNVRVLFLHAREIIEQLSIGNFKLFELLINKLQIPQRWKQRLIKFFWNEKYFSELLKRLESNLNIDPVAVAGDKKCIQK